MRHDPFALWPLLVMLLILAVGLPAHAACTAGNPNASVIESTPISGFTDNNDGTVTHDKLMWKQCAEGLSGADCSFGAATTANWANALMAANTANNAAFAGYRDWRLPNIKELGSIIEYCGSYPAINQTAFPATPLFLPAPPTSPPGPPLFWSGSSYAIADLAWLVDFGDGRTFAYTKSADIFVRLVRGGESVDSFDALNPTASVVYHGNGNTGGSVPVDGGAYANGAAVTVKANTGSLERTGYTFVGWNILPDGSGVSYAGGATFAMGSDNVTLYATWQLCTTISPQSRSLSASAALGSVSITAPSDCSWTATSNSGFITITGASNGSGNGSVNYSIAANATCSERVGTVTIAGQIFTVTQAQVVTVPGAPTGVSATASNGRALITFSAPENTGGTAITAYRFTRFPDGVTRTRLGPSTAPFGFTGLINFTAYTFRVRARNCVNFGRQSAPSNSVTPTPF